MFKKYKDIIFTDTLSETTEGYLPEPAAKNIPDWYKKTNSYINNRKTVEDAKVPQTSKRCMPLFDAMTAGYYLFTHCDIFVNQQDGKPYYQWAMSPAIDFHNVLQADKHPLSKETDFPKFISRWAIKTPPGYSCLFINPMHNPSNIFTIFEGIVDTDKYTIPVNFPFVLNDNNWEGLIPAGTPIAQVIPFKRENFKMSFGGKKEIQEQNRMLIQLKSVFVDAYRNWWRTEKSYK